MATSPEDKVTGWLRKQVARRGLDLLGDDAAFLGDYGIAVTVDQQIAGVHFPPDLAPETIGRRLVAVNISDIAAVGGRPTFGFLALAAPPDYPVRRFLSATEQALGDHDARLAGGDIASSSQLSASLTLLGERRRGSRWVKRSSARVGDRLWVGGTVGTSALGRVLLENGARHRGRKVQLPRGMSKSPAIRRCAVNAVERHLTPPNQLALGAWLSRRRRAAAIDISDGLLLDLERLCRASDVGAVVTVDRLPAVEGFGAAAQMVNADPVELALSGGEDYVLLFTLSPGIRPPAELGASLIGEIRRRPGIELRGASPPSRTGWDHLAKR